MKRYFGPYGGQFVPETLIPALDELEEAYLDFRKDSGYQKELARLLASFAGRPTPLYLARNLSDHLGCRVYLKREDLLHTGAHKINNTLGQIMLARFMGKSRIIAETGAGQHGVATATACSLLKMECHIYMGKTDVERQAVNVERMRLLGARVIPVDKGSGTLEERHQRGLQGLGRERQDHPLSHWERGRAPSVSDAGCRIPVGHRQGGKKTVLERGGTDCPIP